MEHNIEVIVNPKKHIPHFLLFLVCAVCTVVYAITSLKVDRAVVLTNFKMLRPNDLTAAVADTHTALAMRWKCPQVNATAGAVARRDPWGPDSMCRCIENGLLISACATLADCATLENKCYANVVPVYAHVYAGLDVSGINIVLAFFLIHMAVLLNMAAETARDLQQEDTTTNQGKDDGSTDWAFSQKSEKPIQPNAFEPENPLLRVVDNRTENQMIMARFAALGAFNEYKDENMKWNPNANTKQINEKKKQKAFDEARANYSDKELAPISAHDAELADTYAHMASGFIKDRHVQLVLFGLLNVTSCIFAIIRITKVPNGGEQKCDINNACMTQDLLSVVTMTLVILDSILCIVAAFSWNDLPAKLQHSEFAISTYEDMHNIVAFMLLAASFGALSGVHDDTTLLLDVLTIMVIGFLQGVQHNTMLAKEIFIAHCEEMNDKGTVGMLKDGMDKKHYVCTTILSFFLYTRLFIFVLISGCSFVFYMRLASSVGSGETTANWNVHMRFLASLVALTPSFFGDVAYEIRHKQEMTKTGMHLKYSGAHMWRRTVYLLYMIFFAVLSWKTYTVQTA